MNARPRLVKCSPAKRRATGDLLGNTRAATAVEYGLIVALIVIAIILAIMSVAEVTAGIWNNVNDKVARAH